MSKKLPKKLRQDSLIFKLGVTAKRIRKDRDQWELVDNADEARMYYEDMLPA